MQDLLGFLDTFLLSYSSYPYTSIYILLRMMISDYILVSQSDTSVLISHSMSVEFLSG
jgi:hypothetical protein